MLNGLDLFSGIAGISLALEPWVKTVAYCESDRYAQAVLLSRMASNDIPRAPIWDDVTSLRGSMLPDVHIIFGGFPCQDLSTAGRKAGLGGKRSSLFYEITRLAEELKPPFVFLENIAQGINRYEETIASEFDRIGYTARALKMSAFDVGANHERFRWFCLAHSNSINLRITDRGQKWTGWEEKKEHFEPSWWTREPMFSGVANGLPHRLERARALGNAVVPLQAREAFKRLIGIQ